MGQTITVDPVTRVEGHAKILLDLDDNGNVLHGHLQVLEIRGFEKLVEKMELFKMPQIIARICGVCPAAHHLASVIAIENGLEVTPPSEARLLRELLYMGHILQSHTLSTFFLAGPDLLLGIDAKPDTRNIFGLLNLDAELAKKVLRLRSIGQRTVELVGGRGVHPVAAIPGGMSARPDREKLELITNWGKEALALLDEVLPRVGQHLEALEEIRDIARLPSLSMGLSNDGAVDFLEGEALVVNDRNEIVRRFGAADYAEHLVEHVMPSSYMKTVHLRGPEESTYFVGPLARLNVNCSFRTPRANTALREFRGQGRPRLSALDFVAARIVEMIHCAERMVEIPEQELSGGPLRIVVEPAEGRYRGMVESPRGILIHDYTADSDGRISEANLIVATQNNYDAIDSSITAVAGHFMPMKNDNQLMNGMEFALRCFDPCLSCATHTAGRMPMEVVIRHGSEVLRTVSRRFGL
ncbi:MAG: Ni/Fe hydrogenase subunit alpha [Desulfuromonadales bacterium]|nr:Ni/Fe hydrogenase subunit alpha [Desulfuromonadales bacterium]